MINLTPNAAPPYAAGNDLDRLLALLAFVVDHKAVAANIADITQARIDAHEVIKSADKINAEIEASRQALNAERANHDKQLAAERVTFENTCNHRDQQISALKDQTEKLHHEAQAARDEAVRITADLQSRLERVKAAAA
jgi:chromosome segregation ATPase